MSRPLFVTKIRADTSTGPRVLAAGRVGRVVQCASGHTQLQIGAMSLALSEAALIELLSTLRKAVRSIEEDRLAPVVRRALTDLQ